MARGIDAKRQAAGYRQAGESEAACKFAGGATPGNCWIAAADHGELQAGQEIDVAVYIE